jgi:hypothetical protein
MDTLTRHILALAVIITIQIVFGSTVLFFVRRYKKIEPKWSWLKTTGGYITLSLLVGLVTLVPGQGKFASLILSLVGLKRLSGLDVLSTFILSFVMGVVIFVLIGAVEHYFEVELLGLDNRSY